MSKCNSQADLHREMARVYDTCKGTVFEGKEYLCVKQNSRVFFDLPRFSDQPDTYEFALDIVEDKLVWEGWQAAIATKQAELTATKQSEREGWRYSGELELERKRLQAELNATKREQHQNQLDLLEQLTIANRIIARKQAELNKADKKIKRLSDALDYSTGYIEGQHGSLAELMNWKNSLAAEVVQANTTITALQAKIAESDKQEPLAYWCPCDDPNYSLLRTEVNDLSPESVGYKPLFTRPPITPQRELELLAVIEQMRDAFQEVVRISDRKHDAWDRAKEALALTPDMTALKEHSTD